MVHEKRTKRTNIEHTSSGTGSEDANLDQSTNLVETLETPSPALATHLEDSLFETRRLRKDGWDGARMATFVSTLAETGVVTLACRACGMSSQSAYALRQRQPLFARAWEAAISLVREKLADELLARSLKGSAEQLLRDGAIVGERHHFDNKLAFAILRRLDRRAELGTTFRTPPACEIPIPAPAVSGEWQPLLDALSEDRIGDAEHLLTPPAREVDGFGKVDNPPIEAPEGNSFDHPRIWHSILTGQWCTNYPPPPGFEGPEQGEWDEEGYWRGLTEGEHAALVSAGIAEADLVVTIEQDEAERDSFFAGLAAEAGRERECDRA